MTASRQPRLKEGDIQAQILNVLRRLPYVKVDRYQTGMLANPVGQMVSFGSTGSPDILACIAPLGRLLGLECKTPKKKLEPAQIVWAEEVREKGGFAFRVDALDSACEYVLFVYAANVQLLRKAGDLTEQQAVEMTATAETQMAEAKRQAAEVQAKKERRRVHMPTRGKLPPGTNAKAGF